jgi:hypothetical protein
MAELHPADAPAIAGLRFRTYAGPEDLPDLTDIANAAAHADEVTDVWAPEMMRLELEGATHSDPREDVLIATVDDRPVAFARTGWSDATDGDRHYWSLGHVHPGLAPPWDRPHAARPQRGPPTGRRHEP